MIEIALLEDNEVYATEFEAYFGTTNQEFVCVFKANNTKDFMQQLVQYPNIKFVLIDIDLGNESGLDMVAAIYRQYPTIQIVMLTAVESRETLIKALASGASGYLLKSQSFEQITDYLHISTNGGAMLSPTMARQLVQYFQPSDYERGKLAVRSKQVLHFLAEGWSYKLIASNMGITIDGVRFHIKEIYKTLNVQSKPQAVRKYLDGDY
jgi:DNA-binding NarL/FixJ family response regulator